MAVFDPECVEFGSGLLKAKAIDDRVGCAVMLELLKEELPMDCTFAFSTQEEVGTRGAFAYAFSVHPEIALVVEGTTASDIPGTPEHMKVCAPGLGRGDPFMDGGTIYDRGLFELLRRLAEENKIPLADQAPGGWRHRCSHHSEKPRGRPGSRTGRSCAEHSFALQRGLHRGL